MKNTKLYVALAHWYEDYETYGTNVVGVSFSLTDEMKSADEVQIWIDGEYEESVFFDRYKSKWETY